MKKSFVISTNREKDILADVTFTSDKNKMPVVIFCHGYKGYKDWGAWNLIADKFVEAGCFFLKFNFSHNGGTLENPIDFPDLEAFGKNTLSLEVKDLHSVLDWVSSANEFFDIMDLSNITVIGHSRGGGIATLVTSQNKNISKLISWAAVADFGSRFPTKEKALDRWKSSGVAYVLNGRTKQKMPHYFSFYEDFLENKEKLNISKAAASIEVPHLIIHGDSDEAVSVNDAHHLANANKKAILKIVKDANHTFNSKHPWDEKELPKNLQEIVNISINFIQSSNKL